MKWKRDLESLEEKLCSLVLSLFLLMGSFYGGNGIFFFSFIHLPSSVVSSWKGFKVKWKSFLIIFVESSQREIFISCPDVKSLLCTKFNLWGQTLIRLKYWLTKFYYIWLSKTVWNKFDSSVSVMKYLFLVIACVTPLGIKVLKINMQQILIKYR